MKRPIYFYVCLEFFHASMDQRQSMLWNIFQFTRWAELQMFFGKNMKWLLT